MPLSVILSTNATVQTISALFNSLTTAVNGDSLM